MLKNNGFTLIEVMIALAIMTVAFTSILMVQSSSIDGVRKSREIGIATMLLKNYMIETEQEFEGRSFTQVSKEKSGKCHEPHTDYICERVIKEVKFPQLSFGQSPSSTQDPSQASSNQMVEKVSKLITKFFTQALREVTVTVSKGPKDDNKVSLSTYWVNLNQEFSINE